MDNMTLDIHKVRKLVISKPHVLNTTTITYDLDIVTDTGTLEITLYASDPLPVEIEQPREVAKVAAL
jgi:hypothetical protein